MENKVKRNVSRHSKLEKWLDYVLKETFDNRAIHMELYQMFDRGKLTKREYGQILLRIDPL